MTSKIQGEIWCKLRCRLILNVFILGLNVFSNVNMMHIQVRNSLIGGCRLNKEAVHVAIVGMRASLTKAKASLLPATLVLSLVSCRACSLWRVGVAQEIAPSLATFCWNQHLRSLSHQFSQHKSNIGCSEQFAVNDFHRLVLGECLKKIDLVPRLGELHSTVHQEQTRE